MYKTSQTISSVVLGDLLGVVPKPRRNLDVIANETGDVTFKDGGVPFQYTFVHYVCVIRLRDDCKKKTKTVSERNRNVTGRIVN